MLGDLDGIPSAGRNFPNLPSTASVRRKINQFAVSRPAWDVILKGFGRHAPGLSAFRIHHIDVGVTYFVGVEGDLFSVWGPSWGSRRGSTERSQLHGVRAVARRYPDLFASRAIRAEGDFLSVGRKIHIKLGAGGGNQLGGPAAWARPIRPGGSPNVQVHPVAEISQAVALARNCWLKSIFAHRAHRLRCSARSRDPQEAE